MKPRIGIIGKGNVGAALARGLTQAGYEARAVGHDPSRVQEVAQWGEAVVLAVPFGQIDNALTEMGEAVKGKPLVDVTNALTPDYELALGCTTSGAEQLQAKAPEARVVKAFNTIFSAHMDTGKVRGERLTALVAGDDAPAKALALQLARDIGFDAVDAGPLLNARWLETLAMLNISLGYEVGWGGEIGFKLVHPPQEETRVPAVQARAGEPTAPRT